MSKRSLVSELTEEQLDELLVYTPNFSEQSLENIKRLSLEKIQEAPIRRNFSMKKIAFVTAAAVLLLVTSAAVFAATGGLEAFLSRFNPNFGEFAIAPLEPAYAVDEGIRIEAVGAQQIGEVVLVYITMQDLSGDNRLTRHMLPDVGIFIDEQRINGPSFTRLLSFDRASNTAHFERIIAGEFDESGIPELGTIELRTRRITCSENSGQIQTVVQGDWSFYVNTTDLGIRPIIWTDIHLDDIHIETISLTPFGISTAGTYLVESPNPQSLVVAEIEFENRRRNKRFSGAGGGVGFGRFTFFEFADSPIDLEAVTAVIINGQRVPVSEMGGE